MTNEYFWQNVALRALHKQVKELTLENIALKTRLLRSLNKEEPTAFQKRLIKDLDIKSGMPGLFSIETGFPQSLEDDIQYLAALRLKDMMAVPQSNIPTLQKKIFSALQEFSWPKVNILSSIFREEDIKNCIASHHKQIYPNYSSVIVAHGDNNLQEKIEKAAIGELKDYTIIVVSRKHPVGYCYNEDIKHCDGDYIAKIDDDDFYGPWYVMDFIIAMERTGSAVASKKSFFTWLEKRDQVHLIHPNCMNTFVDTGIGCSITIRRSLADRIPFPETHEPIMDQVFYRECVAQGHEILSIHPFGMVVQRRSDKNKHIWKSQDKEILKAPHLHIGKGTLIPILLEEQNIGNITDRKIKKSYTIRSSMEQAPCSTMAYATKQAVPILGLEKTFRKSPSTLFEIMSTILYKVYGLLPRHLKNFSQRITLIQILKQKYLS